MEYKEKGNISFLPDKNNYESASVGYANGISIQLAKKQAIYGCKATLTLEEKLLIIEKAAKKFGEFLNELGVDWQNDPNSMDTPQRVAKAYVLDLWKGRYEAMPSITNFPSENYEDIIFEGNIPLTSMCSHHHQTITGVVHVAYVPSYDGKVMGLSKLNRIVEHFGRRGAIQEQLTLAIHNAIDKICIGNRGVAVAIIAHHNCVKCRGVKHHGISMRTQKFSGVFNSINDTFKKDFYEFIRCANLVNN